MALEVVIGDFLIMNDVSQEHIAVAVRMRPMNAREVSLQKSMYYIID